MQKLWLFIFIIGTVTFLSACADDPVPFPDLYKGDLDAVTRIHITDGGSGHTQALTSPEKVNAFLVELSNTDFTKTGTEANDLIGVLYGVGFYEEGSDDPVFTMTTNIIGDKEYEPSKDLGELFKIYFDAGEKVD